ncbi:MAG: type II secretion system F family protein [Patescibacteria group bacterium]
MIFRYQVLDQKQKLYQGTLEADTLRGARLSLMQQGYDVLVLESVKQRYIKWSFASVGIVSLKEKMLFVKHLSLMIKSGMVLDESIEALYDQSRGRMKMILARLLEMVRKGNLLSDGLGLYPYTFNEFFVNMIRVGEQSGSMEENLINLAVKLKKDHDLRSKVRSALMYPTIVLFALLGLGITLSILILPKLIGFFKSLTVDIPTTTKVFIVMAEFIQSYWLIGSIAFLALLIAIAVMNKTQLTKAAIHFVVLNLPIARSFSKTSNLSNFCRSMNLMLKGGMTIDEALDIMTRALNNVLYERRIKVILEHVKKGNTMSEAMQRFPRFFPPIVTKMIRVGEVSGNLSDTFEYLAEFFEDELDSYSKNLSTLLEPVLLIFIGIIVGFIAMAIISPVYQLTGGIAR